MKLVQSFSDFLSMNAATLGLTRQEYTSRYLSEAFENINDLTKALHFEIDPKAAEEMKIELGKRQGEVTRRKQIESGEYSLRRFRKEIKYDETGEDLGVFKPGSYMAATSTLGDGKHTKAVKKVKWNKRKYDKWVKELAYDNDGGGQDSSYGFEMAQNAKFEPGLIDYIKRTNRGEDPLQRIQWDIEAAMESVSNPSLKFIKPFSLFEARRGKVHKAAKQGSYPAVIVVVQDGKVIHQEPVSTPEVAPAAFNVMQEKYPKALIHLEDKTGKRLFSESIVTEEKIKYAKGKTYQSSGHWTVMVDSNSSMCDIRVNQSAGWRLDPHDDREETWELLDGGRQRATIYFRSGNIDKFAKQMFDLNDRTTWGNKTKLTAKDYADIIRVWIDMKKANESVVTEAKKIKVKDIENAWDSVYGEDFEQEYSGAYDEIMRKYKGKITKAELADLWYNKYSEDLQSEYGGFFDSLDESVVNEAKDMKFTDFLEILDKKFLDAMKAVRGDNGSDAAITPTRGDILQNFTLFRNYASVLTKKYKGDKTKLRFLTEKVRGYESVIDESIVNEAMFDITDIKKPGLIWWYNAKGDKAQVTKIDTLSKLNFPKAKDAPKDFDISWGMGTLDQWIEKTGEKKPKVGEVYDINESVVNESDKTPTMLLAAEIDGAEFHVAFGDGTTVDARATKKTWDDGVPVLKHIARAPKKSVTMPKGKFEVVIDDKYGWIYWQDKGVWYGMDKDDNYIPFEF